MTINHLARKIRDGSRLERDEALDLGLAELGLHQVTLAASADDDHATAIP